MKSKLNCVTRRREKNMPSLWHLRKWYDDASDRFCSCFFICSTPTVIFKIWSLTCPKTLLSSQIILLFLSCTEFSLKPKRNPRGFLKVITFYSHKYMNYHIILPENNTYSFGSLFACTHILCLGRNSKHLWVDTLYSISTTHLSPVYFNIRRKCVHTRE